MIRKTAARKYLETGNVLIEDTSPMSNNYFKIVTLSDTLHGGKNIIRLQGSTNLEINKQIFIEVLDANNNTVYHEVTTVLEDDGSRVVSIWVYPETGPGPGTITLVGTALNDLTGNQIPERLRTTPNLRWRKQVTINPLNKNSSGIVYNTAPTVSITEIQKPLITRSYQGSGDRFSTYSFYTSSSFTYTNYNNSPTLTLDNPTIGVKTFLGSMLSGTVYVSASFFTSTTPETTSNVRTPNVYSSSIDKVLNSYIVRLATPFESPRTDIRGTQTIRTGNIVGDIAVRYEQDASTTDVTRSDGAALTGSVALLTISNLSPETGDVNRVHVYLKKNSTAGLIKSFKGYESPGAYVKVADTAVQAREVLLNDTVSTVDTPIGRVDTAAAFNKWTQGLSSTLAVSGSVFTSRSAYPLVNAIGFNSASGTPTLFGEYDYFTLKTSGSYEFNAGTTYNLNFDAIVQSNTNFNAAAGYYSLDIVLSGSACVDTYLDLSHTKYIGGITKSDGYMFEDNSFDFTVPATGTAQLVFILRAGMWSFSDISIRPIQESGFTPNKLELVFPIEDYIGETYDVKVEYCDYMGNRSDTISEIKDFKFTPTTFRATSITAGSVYADNISASGSISLNNHKLFNYGQFISNVEQSCSANTRTVITYETQSFIDSINLISGSQLQFVNSGKYLLAASVQYYNTANTDIIFDTWAALNGTDIPSSTSRFELHKIGGSNGYIASTYTLMCTVSASQYVQLYWACNANTGRLLPFPVGTVPTHPSAPSVRLEISQVA